MGYLLLRVSNFGIAFSSVFSTITTTRLLICIYPFFSITE